MDENPKFFYSKMKRFIFRTEEGMKVKKVIGLVLAAVMTAGVLTGCGNTEVVQKAADSGGETETAQRESGEEITLEYWTWFPGKEQAQEAIDTFESENPGIKIKMTVMESKTFREKVSLALSTDEKIDIIGVQPSAFAGEVQDYLADLEPLMEAAVGAGWKDNYSGAAYQQANELTGGETKMLTLVNSGSMIGFYNVDLLNEIGCEVPVTFEEYKNAAEKLKALYPDKYAGVFAGKEAWVCDEMMLTVLGQQGDTYNKWRYEGAAVNSPEYLL